MTTENALAGGDAASAPVTESVSSSVTEQAHTDAQTKVDGQQAPAEGADKSGESDAAKNTDDKGKSEEPKRNRAQERIDDLTRKRHDAERRAAAAEAELERLRKPLPTRADMTEEERDRLNHRQSYRDEMAENAEANAREAVKQAAVTRQQIFEAKVEAVKDRHPDALAKFYAVLCSPMMADYLAESDKAGELAAHLGSNPHESRRIAELPVARQAIELAKIEGRLSSAPEVRRVSQAPAPAETRLAGGSSPAAFDAAKASMTDYAKHRQAELRAERKR